MPATTEEQDEQFYRDTESVAFPKLNDHQLSLLEPLAERRVMKRGDVLFKAGQRDLGLAIVLRGELEAFETRDGTEYNLATARVGGNSRCEQDNRRCVDHATAAASPRS